MKYSLIYRLADAPAGSLWWNSAASAKAEDIAALIVQRSWCEDDFAVDCLTDYIASEYAELLRLITCRKG